MSDPTPDNEPASSERPPGLEDLTDFDIAWPTSTDTLRASTSTTGARASIESAYGGDYRRAEGYRKAAMVLADKLSHGQRDDEVLVYPFVYCWRHHLELLLKQLITDSARCMATPCPLTSTAPTPSALYGRAPSPSLDAIINRLHTDAAAAGGDRRSMSGAGTANRLPLLQIKTRGSHESVLRKADATTSDSTPSPGSPTTDADDDPRESR